MRMETLFWREASKIGSLRDRARTRNPYSDAREGRHHSIITKAISVALNQFHHGHARTALNQGDDMQMFVHRAASQMSMISTRRELRYMCVSLVQQKVEITTKSWIDVGLRTQILSTLPDLTLRRQGHMVRLVRPCLSCRNKHYITCPCSLRIRSAAA